MECSSVDELSDNFIENPNLVYVIVALAGLGECHLFNAKERENFMTDFDQPEYISKKFNGLELSGLTLSATEFDDCTFVDCDFSEATFSKCKFIDCHFIRCNLSVVKLNYSRLMHVTFESSKLIGVDWTKASWSSISSGSPIRFMKCILSDSSFFGLELRELSIDECKIHDADFREADLTEADFQYSDLSHSPVSSY